MSQHVSMLTIDALAAGMLGADEAAQARAHIGGCERCAADLEHAQAACAKFTRDVLPRTRDALRRKPWWMRLLPIALPALAVAGIALWFVRQPDFAGQRRAGDEGGDIRVKGAVTYQVFAKRGESVFTVTDGATLAAGDAIRFVVGARNAGFVLIGSVDGAGKASIYYPSQQLAGPTTELPGSIVLDDAPGPERVFAVFSTKPLDADAVTRALVELGERGAAAIRSTRELALPGVEQASLVFEKAQRR